MLHSLTSAPLAQLDQATSPEPNVGLTILLGIAVLGFIGYRIMEDRKRGLPTLRYWLLVAGGYLLLKLRDLLPALPLELELAGLILLLAGGIPLLLFFLRRRRHESADETGVRGPADNPSRR
jgi:hypothetical protein